MSRFAIETNRLTKRFTRHKQIVDNLDLKVPAGSIYVFLGRNGAGKTTTIRMLMGLLKRTGGKVNILGKDPEKDPVGVKVNVGYVAERQRMYDWMSIKDLLNFSESFYPTWARKTAYNLLDKFCLSEDMKLKDLSRGMYGKLSLILALAHSPEILIFDDPMAGLDPVVRREVMETIIEYINNNGRTVFFSTHIVNEIERVADNVGILENGKLIFSGTIESLKSSVRKIRMVFDGTVPTDINITGILDRRTTGHELTLTVKDYTQETGKELARFHPSVFDVFDMTLEDIFISMVKQT